MKKQDMRTALQLYSVREEMNARFADTLKAVGRMGYDGVEFAGLFGHSAEETRRMCEEAGVVPISAHVSFPELLADTEVFRVYRDIGCRYLVIPSFPGEYRPDGPSFAKAVRLTRELGQRAADHGMKLCYHNHDFEFMKIDGRYALDLLYEDVPAPLLSTEIDTCWAAVAGEDPAAYLRKYAGRAEIVHLKDYVGGKSENMYGLIGEEENKKEPVGGTFAFRPLGRGRQDLPAIVAAAEDAGAEWLTVEQDEPSEGLSAMECAEISIRCLRDLLGR